MALNLQNPGIEWTHAFGRPGYTLNPIRGCTHQCEWRMPDGAIAKCYAKGASIQLKVAYPNGFEDVRFIPEELKHLDKLEEPSGIFIDSMSDLFGVGTKREWTSAVLDAIAGHPQHIFFSLTKNAPRLRDHVMPRNLWVGISSPATFMFGKELNEDQQRAWFRSALSNLSLCKARIRWLSLEPLTLDLAYLLREFKDSIDWVVIGAASNGKRKHQPDVGIFKKTLAAVYPKPVFFKGNLDRRFAIDVAGRWMEDFPDYLKATP